MAIEYKTLVFNDDANGRATMAQNIDQLSRESWTLRSREVTPQNWSFGKTCCLGCIFLPLALLGKKKNIITVIMERDASIAPKSTTKTSKEMPIAQDTAAGSSSAIIDKAKTAWLKTWWGATIIVLLIIFVATPLLIGFADGFTQGFTESYNSSSN